MSSDCCSGQVPPPGNMGGQHVARDPVLGNERCSAPCYRPQTRASNLAKSPEVSKAWTLWPRQEAARVVAAKTKAEKKSCKPPRGAGDCPRAWSVSASSMQLGQDRLGVCW